MSRKHVNSVCILKDEQVVSYKENFNSRIRVMKNVPMDAGVRW